MGKDHSSPSRAKWQANLPCTSGEHPSGSYIPLRTLDYMFAPENWAGVSVPLPDPRADFQRPLPGTGFPRELSLPARCATGPQKRELVNECCPSPRSPSLPRRCPGTRPWAPGQGNVAESRLARPGGIVVAGSV